MLKDATIVFDLDGTLVDTAPDLTNALNDVLTRHGHAAVSAEAVRASVGLGARVMIEEALRRAGVTDDVDGMLAEFLIHYETNIARESRPFPGAVAALEALASGGQGSWCAPISGNTSPGGSSKRLSLKAISARSPGAIP
jgi:phosphoglycolate phosphatase